MDNKTLRIINILTTLAVIVSLVLRPFLPYLYNFILSFIFTVAWLVLYLNLRLAIKNFIDTHKKEGDIRIEEGRERQLNRVTLYLLLAWILIWTIFYILVWIYMREQFSWGVLYILLVTIFLAFHNIFAGFEYILGKKSYFDKPSLLVFFIGFFSLGIFSFFYMREQFVSAIVFIIILSLIISTYSRFLSASRIMKKIANKPVNVKRAQYVKLFNYAILIVLVFSFIFVHFIPWVSYFVLDLIGIGPFILLFIVVNTWNFIEDIKPSSNL